MRRFITAILACITLFVTLGASAEAAPIRECGNMPHKAVSNITARKFTCKQARAIVRNYIAAGGKAHMLYETKVEHRTASGGYFDIRLWDRGGWVVRFQWGD